MRLDLAFITPPTRTGSASVDRDRGDIGLWGTGSSSRGWVRLRLNRGSQSLGVGWTAPAISGVMWEKQPCKRVPGAVLRPR